MGDQAWRNKCFLMLQRTLAFWLDDDWCKAFKVVFGTVPCQCDQVREGQLALQRTLCFLPINFNLNCQDSHRQPEQSEFSRSSVICQDALPPRSRSPHTRVLALSSSVGNRQTE